MGISKVTIFNYDDPREYIRSIYILNNKNNSRYYTYEKFAELLGISNKGFIYNYMYPAGKKENKKTVYKKLSDLHCKIISKRLLHTNTEARYFLTIVHADQCQDEEDRKKFIKEAEKIVTSTKIEMITKDQIGYYSQWYHSVIRSIIGIQSIKKDFEQIASMVFPPITPEQAKKSIKLLLDLNMITVGEDGSYQLVKNIVNTGKDIPQNIKDNAHIKFTGLAQNAIKTMPPQSRYAISHTVGISEKTYREITKEIESFRATVRGLIDKDTDPNRVYQLEILMFPLSSDIIED